jgi:hypothetical protein
MFASLGTASRFFSHGCGDHRPSAGADIGVGKVEPVMAVVADRGVELGMEAVIGVYGVNGTRAPGERSGLAECSAGSRFVLLGLRRPPTDTFRAI